MKRIIFLLFIAFHFNATAQHFIDAGMIEYEVRVNNHKVFGDGIFAEMFKDKIPQFSTSYYHLFFNKDKALYKFDRIDEKGKLPWGDNSEQENIWYNDYRSGNFTDQKFVFDNTYLLSDSLIRIDWKLVPNETREIAGFTCRKAVGKVFDSVYIFAFYTDEITLSGGPMGISGLPGMIMGITVPRMFTSWIATKVEIADVNLSQIVIPQKGKKKKATELQETVIKATKDWGSWGQQAVWKLFL